MKRTSLLVAALLLYPCPSLAQRNAVVLDGSPARLMVGQQVRLKAHVESAAGATLDEPVAWRATNSSYVSLASDGRMTGIRQGRVTIIAMSGEASASFEVEVIPNTLGWVTVTPASARARVGEPVRFGIDVIATDGERIDGLTPTWSVAPGPATIARDGTFTALAPGEHVVYATIADRTGSAVVTVTGGARERIRR